jgi:hypothetical protein
MLKLMKPKGKREKKKRRKKNREPKKSMGRMVD